MEYLNKERRRINQVIELLNENGFNIPLIISYRDFISHRLPRLKNRNRKYIRLDSRINAVVGEDLKTLKREYLYLINEHVRNLVNNIDNRKAGELVIKEEAKALVNSGCFIYNGFVSYINKRVFEIDMNESLEVIMYKLMFEWYDLSEEKRRIYRKLAKIKMKTYENYYCRLKNEPKIDLQVEDFVDEMDE